MFNLNLLLNLLKLKIQWQIIKSFPEYTLHILLSKFTPANWTSFDPADNSFFNTFFAKCVETTFEDNFLLPLLADIAKYHRLIIFIDKLRESTLYFLS